MRIKTIGIVTLITGLIVSVYSLITLIIMFLVILIPLVFIFVAVLLIIGSGLILSGIGIIKLKKWAKNLGILLYLLSFVLCLSYLGVALFIKQVLLTNSSIMISGMGSIGSGFLALGLISLVGFLYLLFSKKVKEAFN